MDGSCLRGLIMPACSVWHLPTAPCPPPPACPGKSTFIKYLLGRDYPGIHIGPEPTTDR